MSCYKNMHIGNTERTAIESYMIIHGLDLASVPYLHFIPKCFQLPEMHIPRPILRQITRRVNIKNTQSLKLNALARLLVWP